MRESSWGSSSVSCTQSSSRARVVSVLLPQRARAYFAALLIIVIVLLLLLRRRLLFPQTERR